MTPPVDLILAHWLFKYKKIEKILRIVFINLRNPLYISKKTEDEIWSNFLDRLFGMGLRYQQILFWRKCIIETAVNPFKISASSQCESYTLVIYLI